MGRPSAYLVWGTGSGLTLPQLAFSQRPLPYTSVVMVLLPCWFLTRIFMS